MRKLTILMLMLTMAVVTNCHGLTRTYQLVGEQSDKTELDSVEVGVEQVATFTDNLTITASQIKAEIARLETKATVVSDQITALEAELAKLYVEAEKYELVIPELPEEEQL